MLAHANKRGMRPNMCLRFTVNVFLAVQVADALCQLAKPAVAQVCSAESACQLSAGVDCSGNGLCSASAGKCICNQGWQVPIH